MVTTGPSLDFVPIPDVDFPIVVLVSGVDFDIFFILSPPLASSVVSACLSLDITVLISSLDFAPIFVGPPTPNFLLMDPLLAPSIIVVGLSFGVSKVVPPMVPLLGATVLSWVFTVTSSSMTFSLASRVSGSGYDGADF